MSKAKEILSVFEQEEVPPTSAPADPAPSEAKPKKTGGIKIIAQEEMGDGEWDDMANVASFIADNVKVGHNICYVADTGSPRHVFVAYSGQGSGQEIAAAAEIGGEFEGEEDIGHIKYVTLA